MAETVNRRQDIGSKVVITVLCSVITILLLALVSISMDASGEAIECAEAAKIRTYSNSERLSVLEAQFHVIDVKLDTIEKKIDNGNRN